MDLKDWYAAARHCGIIYYLNKPAKGNGSAKINFYTIVQESNGPRLERASPMINGEYNEKLAKSLHYRINDQAFYVSGYGFSRSDHLLDNIHSEFFPGVKREFITLDLLGFDK